MELWKSKEAAIGKNWTLLLPYKMQPKNMNSFLNYHLYILKPILESIETYFPQSKRAILHDYFIKLYCDYDIPALWVEALSRKLGGDWKAPSDDLSELATDCEDN